MTPDRNQYEDTDRLPDEAARRLLVRASELEAIASAETSLGELREVAREAGIGPAAFEQALAELRGRDTLAVPEPVTIAPKGLARFRTAALAALLTAGFFVAVALLRLVP
jgi:hypothetical protein